MTIHRRRSIRLKDYDYSQPGSYFVTLCTHGHECLFGDITDGEMVLNNVGEIVEKCLIEIPGYYQNVELDKWTIMPNHVHAIIVIYPDNNIVGARHASPLRIYKSKIHGPKSNSIGSIVSSLKSAVTKRINESQNTPSRSIWQRNYYEHIIRDEHELNKIRRYIINNPPHWEYDRENRNGLPIDDKQTFWSKFLTEFD